VTALWSRHQSPAIRGLGLLEEHMGTCVVDAARAGGDEADAKVKEASDAIARLVRS
jgi:CsoR family transcriptional regulator, copper-sensing transcriptional repressor